MLAEKIDIRGAKGGSSSPKAPTGAVDSLRSTNVAKILIAVGEGEFDGTPTAANIYLDDTPINDASGNVNFPNVKWEWRTGAVDQSYIPGIPSVENETTVNVELRSDTAWVRSLTNTQLSAVRLRFAWPALQQQDENGCARRTLCARRSGSASAQACSIRRRRSTPTAPWWNCRIRQMTSG